MKSYNTELSLVAVLMGDNSAIMEIDLLPEEFAFEEPRSIYIAIQTLTAQRIPADIITVADYMDANHGGAHWFERIGNYVHNSTGRNAKVYADSIRQNATKRRSVEIANRLSDDARLGQSAVDEAIKALMELGSSAKKHSYTIKETLRAAVDDIEKSMIGGDMPGTPSGIEPLDSITGGFHDSDFIVIGARPAMGKTAFMLNCAIGAGAPVGIISSEQGHSQIGSRLIAIDGMVSISKMRRAHKLDDSDFSRITVASNRLMEGDIYINDMPSPSMSDIARQARKWKFSNGITALYVDYIQRIRVDGSAPRNEQIGNIAMSLKELARELNIPVIALAQCSRGVEQRPDKRPGMADLKDSGGIEQEADLVMTLYRDEVYDMETDDKGVIEILIAKNRHGETGRIKAAWLGEYLKVGVLEHRYAQTETQGLRC